MDLGDQIRGGSSGGDAGRAFRIKHGFLFATAGIKAGRLGRDARGRYTTFQNELTAVNLGLAIELQELTAEKLEESRVPSRRGVASGRLEAALLDRRNRGVTNAGYGVGSIEWLDHSQAKYWRSIEVGTTQFVGNLLPAGLWGGTLTGTYGGQSGFGPYPLAGAPWTTSGANRSGRIRPMGQTYAYRLLAASGMSKRAAFLQSKKKASVIEEPIHAHLYLKHAWQQFEPGARTTAAVRRALKVAGIAAPRALGS